MRSRTRDVPGGERDRQTMEGIHPGASCLKRQGVCACVKGIDECMIMIMN